MLYVYIQTFNRISESYWEALFSSLGEKFLGTITFSFIFDNYCSTMDQLDSKDLSYKL